MLLSVYFVTLVAMAVTTFSNPGTLDADRFESEFEPARRLPERAHMNKGYATPVLRYDHYCRWVMNVIGLMNHRPFVALVVGLLLCIVSSVIFDGYLLLRIAIHRWDLLSHVVQVIIVVAHLCLYVVFGTYVLPIVKIHVGCVSRNELCLEYCDCKHQVFNGVPVEELDEDEYNERFEAFAYDSSLNKWDKGNACHNCFIFWTTPRGRSDQLGEF